ncbi:MAG: polyprenyl synthetase [Planctomycetaceae bacterium]|nr:polyprenyl synthetase [Planctomycetaceae bacterium]
MSKQVARHDLLERVTEYIGDDLLKVEQIFSDELATDHEFVADIQYHVSRFRGKRLRPILMLLTAKALGEVKHDHMVLAAVVEMIHTATLVHDDVLDDAATRRHVATVNSRWNNETSVLYGDYLFTHAFHLASSLDSTLGCRLIGQATNVVCVGELSQINERGNSELSEEHYLRIIDQKTAELCALSCRLGALFGDADEDIVNSMDCYGRSLGIAFQIADDILDVIGEEEDMGKTLGSDLQKQKLTLPLIRLLEQLGEAEAAQVREILAQPNEETGAALKPYFARCEAIEYAHHRAIEFAQEARQQIEKLPDSEATQILADVAEFAVNRNF